jgi:hypothetical protein
MPTDSPNRALLDEVNAAGLWFRAKKTRPIWARRVDVPQQVRTPEGREEAPAGSYLCRGESGDVWPQAAERLFATYLPTGDVTADGWRQFAPRPDGHGVWAARVDHPFEVLSAWGRLRGKPGDYLVKDFAGGDAPYPTDVWIVDAHLFAETYEPFP